MVALGTHVEDSPSPKETEREEWWIVVVGDPHPIEVFTCRPEKCARDLAKSYNGRAYVFGPNFLPPSEFSPLDSPDAPVFRGINEDRKP